ncbi:MAG: N-acetylneuraminate synthase family protein [Spirochaetales bacterium]|nr:N-acetylneuraminate synthase family protein [Spirochaetales bacterium]
MTVTRPRIVAEIGTAHEGDLQRARSLIEAAREAGADTAKFQLVRSDEILHPRSGTVRLPGGRVPLYDRFRELERSEEFYGDLKRICRETDIRFLCTPFGIESARLLRHMEVEEIKIASPELNHLPLLREVATYQKPLILSVGVATVGDIDEALSAVQSGAVTLLQCVTAYPAPEEEYNLRVIPAMSDLFGVPVGVSDHSLDPVIVPSLATLMGASMIEKHITLSRGDTGLDDPIALEPADFATMVREIREITERLAEGSEKGSLEYHRARLTIEERAKSRYGSARVEKVLGTGVKELAPSEQRNYGYTNRSVHALSNLSAGLILTKKNTAVLRSEKNLSPGLHPRYWDSILGATLTRDIAAGDGVTWDHLLIRDQ